MEFDLGKINERRLYIDAIGDRIPLIPDTSIEKFEIEEVVCYWLKTKNSQQDKYIFYLHGGGYFLGSIRSHQGFVSKIIHDSQTTALFVEYRLGPEHPFPAGLDDALLAYQWLIGEKKADPNNIIIMGDSAGAGLALALLQKIKEASIAMPKALVTLSAFVDLTGNSPSLERLKDKDLLLTKDDLAGIKEQYTHNKEDLTNPLISPVFADFAGFPPMLIQTGTYDILHDESVQLAHNALDAGVEVTLEKWENMQHVWYFFFPDLPESTSGYAHITAYIKRWLKD